MAEDTHEAPKGLFEDTIFEGGLFGASHGGHAHKAATWAEHLEHNTKFGYFIFKELAEWGVSRALSLWIIFTGLMLILGREIPSLPLFTLEWVVGTAPVWLPIMLLISTWSIWVWYVQGLYISGRDPVVLDIKIPREITKSPRAMEIALTSFYSTSGEGSFLHRIWHGQVRVWYALEYASFGGEVHMYVWCWKNYRSMVESALYAQFPEIEIQQVEDYASKFKFDPSKHKAFVNEHIYSKSDAFPLKTYIEFELDKDPKEEFKVDPMGQIFEYLSSLKKGEQVWVQVMFRATGKYGSLFNPKNAAKEWMERVKIEIESIRLSASLNPGKEDAPDSDERKYGFPRPTWSQTEQMRIMERQLGKIPFDVAVRGLYIAEKGVYSGATGNGMRWFWKTLNNPGYLNSLDPTRGHNPFDYPWQDFMGLRDTLLIKRYIDAYRRRSAFFAPWVVNYNVMTNEVLATMFHFPSSSISAPGLDRIPATKAKPPPNLPH
jgi:hypothetical protein